MWREGEYLHRTSRQRDKGYHIPAVVLIPCSKAVRHMCTTSVALYTLYRDGRTRVLALDADTMRFTELEDGADDNPFFCDAPTVDLCAMAGGTIVQAHPQVGRSVARSLGRFFCFFIFFLCLFFCFVVFSCCFFVLFFCFFVSFFHS